MEATLDKDVPLLIAGLTPARLAFPAARTKRAVKRARGAGPVPIPFYGQPSAHAHDHVEIALLLEGPVYFEISGVGRTLDKGAVVLLPPRTPHYDTYVSRRCPYAMLWYILWPGQPRVNLSRYDPKRGFRLVWIGELLPQLVTAGDWAFISSIRADATPSLSRVRELLFALYSATLESRRRGGPMRHDDAVRKAVRDAVSFLEDHLPDAPTVEMAASFVGLSPTYLTTIVRKEIGRPLHDVLNRLRVKKARELLLTSSLSVKEIAHLSGFSAADYFSRAFHKVTGLTPRQFRARS
jgi:AraC-like DNA-binding protein